MTSQTYDNAENIAATTDGNGNKTTYAYNVFNRLSAVTNAKGETTAYAYDLNGSMLTKVDGKGNKTTYTYNAAGLLLTETDAGGGKESYTYHADKTVKTRTDRNGNTTTYRYNIHGSLISEETGGAEYTYTYDTNGNLLTMTDKTGTTTRTYDEKGRVLTKTVPNIVTITFTYDLTEGAEEGRHREKSIDPKGNTSIREYDKAGRLSRVIIGAETASYTYYANGNRASITYSNGTREEYTYDRNNRVTTLVNTTANGSVLDRYTYTYDRAGNQLTKHEIIGGAEKGTTAYTYDALNRLLTVTEPIGRSTAYTYDKAGNRETETVVHSDASTGGKVMTVNTYAYDTRNRLTTITAKVNNVLTKATSYTYDSNGNQLKTVVKAYQNGTTLISTITVLENTYDLYNQLIRSITGDGTAVNSSYNAEGYRVVKEVITADGSRGQTYYLYEADKVILETDGNGNQKAWNIYGTNLLMRETSGKTYYYLYNGHADVTALITADGTIAAAYYYDAFGKILEATGAADNSILYAGYQYDEETGLYYINARMYDPVTTRFLQEDTYHGDPKDPLSLHLYTYCHNNPISYYDPAGHAITLISGAIGAGVGFLIGAGGAMISDAITGNLTKDNWRKYVGSGVQGAVIGGVAGLTGGLGLGTVAMSGAGFVSSAVGNTANQVIRNGGFKDFSMKELAVSSLTGGISFGAAGAVSGPVKALTDGIASQALRQTAQGAMVGGVSGATAGMTANVATQSWDLVTKEKTSFDMGSLAKDTITGGIAGGALGGGLGYAGSKYGAKIRALDEKAYSSMSKGMTKIAEGAKKAFAGILKNETGSINTRAQGNYEGGLNSNTVNPKDVNFMQSSIKNETGEYTVLGNSEALKNGTLKTTDLPKMKIWKDTEGQLWTLDHRRLASFRLSGLKEIPFQWATQDEIAGQMWKMTTQTDGTSIKLKLGNGESVTVK